jgi:glucuronate isomerase
MPLLDPDRLFPTDPATRGLARDLYDGVSGLPIVSPHGHTDPRWYATDAPFPDPAQLFVVPDHYVFRMLHSQGVSLSDLGVPRADGGPTETDARTIWRRFAERYHLFRGTPSRLWLDHAFETVFGLSDRLTDSTADAYFDHIADCLTRNRNFDRAPCSTDSGSKSSRPPTAHWTTCRGTQ